ncbi:hypothetical protein H4R24_005011 [Coemansia sp. RSA 988]|nr:hypothetical protein H4R24_005011 [Coemansia sp. RSA 988]
MADKIMNDWSAGRSCTWNTDTSNQPRPRLSQIGFPTTNTPSRPISLDLSNNPDAICMTMPYNITEADIPEIGSSRAACSSNRRHVAKWVYWLFRKETRALHRPESNESQSGQLHLKFCRHVRQVGIRFGSMIIFAALLAVMLVPFHESANIGPFNFKKMRFDWHTDPHTHLVPYDPAYADYNVLIDGHAHTTLSDGRLTPEQLVEYSIAQGFNALIVTDHNTVAGGLRAEKYAREHHPGKFIAIPGMEYSNCRIHMNLIDINSTIEKGSAAFPTDDDIRVVINRTHELGGLVIVNHVPWSTRILDRFNEPRLVNHPSIQSLIEWGVDGFEIINQATFDMPTYQHLTSLMGHKGNRFANISSGLIIMTGSDVHIPGKAYAWTVLNSHSFTRHAIMDEIRNRRTSFLFDPTGNNASSTVTYSSRYLALSPMAGIAGYIASFYDRYQGQYSFHGSHCRRDIIDIHGTSVGFLVVYITIIAVIAEVVCSLCRYAIHSVKHRFQNCNIDKSEAAA